jgi:prepilin-type N-terminal cleavage/methylation domain-containing protein
VAPVRREEVDRTHRRHAASLDRNGFTIVELLVVMLISGLVISSAVGLLKTVRSTSRTERLVVDVQDNARYALSMLTRDLTEAGQGMDPSVRFGVVAVGDGGAGNNDTLYILFADPGTPVHAVEVPPGNVKQKVDVRITCSDPVTDIQDGDFVYLASGSARGVAHVSQVTRNNNGATCSGDPNEIIGLVKLNVSAVDSENHGWAFEANEAGAALERVNAAVYFVDDTDPTSPTLNRATEYDGNWVDMPIADMISEFRVELIFADGDELALADSGDGDSTNDFDDINTVRLHLRGSARRTDKDLAGGARVYRDYTMSVSPRNQLYTRNRQ